MITLVSWKEKKEHPRADPLIVNCGIVAVVISNNNKAHTCCCGTRLCGSVFEIDQHVFIRVVGI